MENEDKKDSPKQCSDYYDYPPFSVNNKFITEPYIKTEIKTVNRGNTIGSYPLVSQKLTIKGLKLLMEAKVFDQNKNVQMVLKKGSIVYVRESTLYNQSWASQTFKSDVVDGEFIMVDLQHVEFIKPA